MATIAEQITKLGTAKADIRSAIEAKGVDVPASTPFRQYADKIAAIPVGSGGSTGGDTSSDGWTRPADRPAVPTVNENEIYMLFGVQPTGPNDYCINLNVRNDEGSLSPYIVDWGDGTIVNMGLTTTCAHIYDYTSLEVAPNTDGIKWVWIKFTAVSGGFTVIDTSVRHSLRPTASSTNIFVPQVYEIYMNAPNVNKWSWNSNYTRFYNLEIFEWQGTNELTSVSYFLYYSVSLKLFTMYTGLCTNFSYFLQGCHSFNQQLDIDTSKGTNFASFLYDCRAYNKPLNIDTSNGTSFNSFLYGYNSHMSFNKPLNINTSNGKSFTSFMYYCGAYSFPLVIDLASATTAIGTSFIGVNNHSLTKLRLLNMGSIHTALTISNSSLDVDALVALFGDLYDRSATTVGALTITGALGASQLTQEQRAIATSKNWTITG